MIVDTSKKYGFFLLAFIIASMGYPNVGYPQITHQKQYDNTELLEAAGDPATRMLEGVDRFLDRQLDQSIETSSRAWPTPAEKPTDPAQAKERYLTATKTLRTRLAEHIGLVDVRSNGTHFVQQYRIGNKTVLYQDQNLMVHEISWEVFPGVQATGLAIQPKETMFCVIAIPDSGQMPEDLCGTNVSNATYAMEIARAGGFVVIPTVISRSEIARNGKSVLTDQEFLYRSAIVLGRHVLGHEVSVVQSALDCIKTLHPNLPVGIVGWGEGGWIALHSAAIDERIDVALVSGHFAPRHRVWQEPMHRNIHGLLPQYSDASLAALVAPRKLILDFSPGPNVDIHGTGAAPGRLTGPTPTDALMEFKRATDMLSPWNLHDVIEPVQSDSRPAQPSLASCNRLSSLLRKSPVSIEAKTISSDMVAWAHPIPRDVRRKAHVDMWDRHQQRILESIHIERNQYWSKLDTSTQQKSNPQ